MEYVRFGDGDGGRAIHEARLRWACQLTWLLARTFTAWDRRGSARIGHEQRGANRAVCYRHVWDLPLPGGDDLRYADKPWRDNPAAGMYD